MGRMAGRRVPALRTRQKTSTVSRLRRVAQPRKKIGAWMYWVLGNTEIAFVPRPGENPVYVRLLNIKRQKYTVDPDKRILLYENGKLREAKKSERGLFRDSIRVDPELHF